VRDKILNICVQAKERYPPPPLDKFVPLHEVPGDLSSPEYECFQHTTQVIRRRLNRRLEKKTIALSQSIGKNGKVDAKLSSEDNESESADDEEDNIPRLAPLDHWSLFDLQNRAQMMLMNMQRLITYLTTTNYEFTKPVIPGSHRQEQRQQRKKAIGQIIVKFRIINQTLDHYLSHIERGKN